MARTKLTEPVLKTWEEANLTLKEIAENELALLEIETEMNKAIHEIKLAAELKAEEHNNNIRRLGLNLKEFVQANKVDLDGKTKQLAFGKTGFRASTKLVVSNAANVIKSLIQCGMTDCINVKQTINKDVLKSYKEDDIIKVGASLKKEDVFWYETDKDKLEV